MWHKISVQCIAHYYCLTVSDPKRVKLKMQQTSQELIRYTIFSVKSFQISFPT